MWERVGCRTDAWTAVCRPNAGSGCHARARGWEHVGCGAYSHAAVCRPNAGSRHVSSKRRIGVLCASSSRWCEGDSEIVDAGVGTGCACMVCIHK
jgi:hypothetical protein